MKVSDEIEEGEEQRTIGWTLVKSEFEIRCGERDKASVELDRIGRSK